MYSFTANRIVHEQMVREAIERARLRAELRAVRRSTQGRLWRHMIAYIVHRREPDKCFSATDESATPAQPKIVLADCSGQLECPCQDRVA